MLRRAKSQGINACPPCSFPFFSTYVVASTRRIEKADRKMAYRVAPQYDAVFPAGCAELPIQDSYDFSIGKSTIAEMPIAPHRRSAHLTSPLSEHLPGGEGILDQFIAPLAGLGCDRCDSGKGLWNGRIVG